MQVDELFTQLKENSPVYAGQSFPWLQRIQEQAKAALSVLPSNHHEEWKYAKLGRLANKQFAYGQPFAKISTTQFADVTLDERYQIVLLNGQYHEELSDLDGCPQGLIVCDLAKAFKHHHALLQQAWEQVSSATQLNFFSHVFVALNVLFMQRGLFIYVPTHLMLDKPLHILHISTDHAEASLTQSMQIIFLDKQAQADIFEQTLDLTQQTVEDFQNHLSYLVLQRDAKLTHDVLCHHEETSYSLRAYRMIQLQASQYISNHLVQGGAFTRREQQLACLGDHTYSELNHVYVATQNAHIDNLLSIAHYKLSGESQVNFRGIIQDNGHAAFNGKILVAPDAQKTSAHMHNRNLLLSSTASVDTKPVLEIYADDVQCSHGATVGDLDQAALFFLRSRGVSSTVAKRLLLLGFAKQNFKAIHNQSIKQCFEDALDQQLSIDIPNGVSESSK